jgi:hypothetical protein
MRAKSQRPPKAAVFVDAENHADLDVSLLIQKLGRFDLAERHAYADWRNRCLDRLFRSLKRAGFEVHHTWSGSRIGAHKDTADGHMAHGIRHAIRSCPSIEVIVIVSGDDFFTGVARQIREQGKRVIVAAATLRTSRELRSVADEYWLLGKLERSIWALNHLEQMSRYLTFRSVVQRSGIRPPDLAELIQKGLVIQEQVPRSGRGTRREIHLNRQAYPVQTVLGIADRMAEVHIRPQL